MASKYVGLGKERYQKEGNTIGAWHLGCFDCLRPLMSCLVLPNRHLARTPSPRTFITSLPLLRYHPSAASWANWVWYSARTSFEERRVLQKASQVQNCNAQRRLHLMPGSEDQFDLSSIRSHAVFQLGCRFCLRKCRIHLGTIWVWWFLLVAIYNYFNSVSEIRQNRKGGLTLQPSCSMHAWWIPTGAFGGLMVLVFQSLTRVMQWAPWTLTKMSTDEKGTSSGEEHGVWWRFVQYIFVCEKMKLRVKQAKENLKLCIQPMSACWVERLFKLLEEAVPSPVW